jgi:hypothetical protein
LPRDRRITSKRRVGPPSPAETADRIITALVELDNGSVEANEPEKVVRKTDTWLLEKYSVLPSAGCDCAGADLESVVQ